MLARRQHRRSNRHENASSPTRIPQAERADHKAWRGIAIVNKRDKINEGGDMLSVCLIDREKTVSQFIEL